MNVKNNVDELTVRFLQGTSTEKENAQFLSWLNESKENEVSFFQMKEILDARQRSFMTDSQKDKPTKHLISAKSLFYSTWMRYAAIITVLFGATLVVNLLQRKSIPVDPIVYVNQIVIHNTRGVHRVELPDGSVVWLHGATTLTYPEQFQDSIRTVDLQGEAYFVVQADEANLFVVQTSTARIRATGTEFNITAYPNDLVTITTLIKGVVDVQPNNHSTSVQLRPGQQAVTRINDSRVSVSNVSAAKTYEEVEKENELPVIIHEINTELYSDWKNGVYRFSNEVFKNIALRLERMYGVDIQIENEALKNAAFSGMFTADYSLTEVLEIINISNPISYTIANRVVTIRNR